MSCLILDVGCLWKKFETKDASWVTYNFTSTCQRLISICCKRNAIKNVEYKNCHNYNFGLMTPLWIWQCGFFRPQQQSWTKRKLLLISGRILLCQVCFWRKTLLPYNIPTFKIWRFKVEQGERKRQIYLQHWWTTLGFQQLLLIDLWQWIVPNMYQALGCQSVFVDTDWCLITFALLCLILLS